MKRFNPIVYFSQGGSTYGDMQYSADGDYVRYDEAQAEIARIKASNAELIEALEEALAGRDYWPEIARAAIERAKG